MSELTILFLGSPSFALPTLTRLFNSYPQSLVGVISQPDAPKGRGKKLVPTPITQFAQHHSIPYWTPTSSSDIESIFSSIKPDLAVVVSYGKIIPKSITDSVTCINVHPSLLPKYRGASPIQAALLNRDAESGVCLMQLNEDMDAGDIIYKHVDPILESDTAGTLHDRYAQIGAKLCLDYIRQRNENKSISQTPQDHDQATYCSKISTEDVWLDPNLSSEDKLARIRAYSPKPGAYTRVNSKRIKILQATCVNNQLIPQIVKPEGKGEMTYDQYLLGHPEGIQC